MENTGHLSKFKQILQEGRKRITLKFFKEESRTLFKGHSDSSSHRVYFAFSKHKALGITLNYHDFHVWVSRQRSYTKLWVKSHFFSAFQERADALSLSLI